MLYCGPYFERSVASLDERAPLAAKRAAKRAAKGACTGGARSNACEAGIGGVWMVRHAYPIYPCSKGWNRETVRNE